LAALIEPPLTVAAARPAIALRDRTSVVHLAVLAGLCALTLFSGLGSTPLWEPDEPRFAAATRHMLRSGDFLDPVFNGRPRWEKPILLYWMQVAPLAIGLDEELAMRLPAAVLGTAAVVCVYALGVVWWSRRAGLVAAALLATTFRFVTYARQGLTDIPALAGIVATFLAFELGSTSERTTRQRVAWWAGWTLVGLTALTKGPLALIAPTIWITATWIRRREVIRWSEIASGAALALLAGGSWFAYMAVHRGGAFVGVNSYEFVQRYFDRSFPGPSRGPLFYLTILPGEIAPWPLVAAAAVLVLLQCWKELDRRGQDGVIIAAAWFAGVLLLCSLSQYKLPHYTLPAYPPLMLLAGAALDRAWRAESMRRVMVASIAITAVVFIAAGAASALAVFRLPDAFRSGAAVIGSACLIGGVTGMVFLRRRPVLAPVALAAATALGYGAAAVLLLPTFALEAYPYPWLGRLVAERASPSVALASIGAHTALVYYADRPVTFLVTASEAARFLSSPDPRLVVLSRGEFDSVKRIVPVVEELAARRRQNPRLSRLLEGRLLQGATEELLVGNAAAAAVYSRGN
jgi:4-amino-4-deoxy-L-arabinose transferase-like glycosyltransferase